MWVPGCYEGNPAIRIHRDPAPHIASIVRRVIGYRISEGVVRPEVASREHIESVHKVLVCGDDDVFVDRRCDRPEEGGGTGTLGRGRDPMVAERIGQLSRLRLNRNKVAVC